MSIIPDLPPDGESGKRAVYSNQNRKPAVIATDPAGIPAELRNARRWVLWRLVWKPKKSGGGKWDKPPFQTNGRPAKSNDPTTWTTFAEAEAAFRRGGFDGLGVMLGDGFAGID